jgi:hypothetical protein
VVIYWLHFSDMIYQYGTESETVNVAADHFSTLPSALTGKRHVKYGAHITNNLARCNHSWKEGCMFRIHVLIKPVCVMSDD